MGNDKYSASTNNTDSSLVQPDLYLIQGGRSSVILLVAGWCSGVSVKLVDSRSSGPG